MIALIAAAAMLPFAPPLDRPIRYEVTERRRRADGGMRAATLEESVRFAAEPGGYAMTVLTTGYRDEGEGDPAFAAMMKPMVGTAIRIHLSPGGVPERVVDGDAAWAAMLSALRVRTDATPEGPARLLAMQTLASMTATTRAERDARLLGAADDLLGTRLPPLAIGAGVATEGGTTTRQADIDGDWAYRETTHRILPGDPPRAIDLAGEVRIARTTGLVTHCVRRTLTNGAMVAESETRMVADPPR